MPGVIDIQTARDRRGRARLDQDIERLIERYLEQHEAAKSLVVRDWDMSWIFFRSLAMEWARRGGSMAELKAAICAEIDAADTGR